MRLNPHAKFGPVDEQTDDDVLHLGRCREADRLAFSQSLGWRHQLLAHFVQGALEVMYPAATDNSSGSQSGKIVSFHHRERGRRHGTEHTVLPTPTGHSGVDLPHCSCFVA